MPHSRVMIPVALFMLSLMICSPLASSQSTSGPEGPGESWTLPSEHNLFLKGELTDPFLDRNWSKLTGEPLGRAEFTKSSSAFSPTLIDIQSAPLSESLRFQGNVTVKLYASLETTNVLVAFLTYSPVRQVRRLRSLFGSVWGQTQFCLKYPQTRLLWRNLSEWHMNLQFRRMT